MAGLLGLLLLIETRCDARVRNGQLVPLAEQDRAERAHLNRKLGELVWQGPADFSQVP